MGLIRKTQNVLKLPMGSEKNEVESIGCLYIVEYKIFSGDKRCIVRLWRRSREGTSVGPKNLRGRLIWFLDFSRPIRLRTVSVSVLPAVAELQNILNHCKEGRMFSFKGTDLRHA